MDTIGTESESEFAIGDVSAVSLAERYATPLYAYDAATIRSTFARICAAVPYEPRQVHYACVANSNLAIMQLIRAQGGGVHANTWGDAVMALSAGFEANDIVYSGSNIGKADMLQLFSHGIAVNLNSVSQLRRYGCLLAELEHHDRGASRLRRDVGLRVNLGDHPLPSRMGVHLDEFDEIDAIAAEHRLRIVGVHYYRGTGTVDTDHFLKPFPLLFDVARRFGATLRYVDVGGGFGFQYSPVGSTQFDWEVFGGAVADMMKDVSAELGREICLILEPGRSVVASSGFLLTSVVAVDKRAGGGQVAGVDTTTSHISKETYRVYGGFRRIVLVSRRSDDQPIMTDVVGCTTFSDDYIGRGARGDRPDRGLMLPPLREGDVLAVLDAGGYGFSFASNFLNKPRPAEVMVDSGRVRLTRRRETYEDMLRLQVF
jgi:diaminopimelate decarboxylase